MRHIRVHDARHTFASLLLQQGESLPYVKEQLGHSSIQVTVDLYGHLIPGANRQAVDRLAKAIASLRAEPARLKRMAEQSRRLGRPDAAEKIVKDCLQLIGA